jgi:hypothetical protein
MENPKNKSLDNLKDDAVNGEEIKGGTGIVFTAPDVYSPLNLPGDPTGATDHADPNLAINHIPGQPGDFQPGDDIFASDGNVPGGF